MTSRRNSMSAPGLAFEKAVIVEVARMRWLLWTSIGFAIAVGLMYWQLPGSSILDPVKAVCGLIGAAGSLFSCIWWLISKRRLIIGETRVLLVSARTQRVVGHIPYGQVDSVHFHHGEQD